MARIYFYDASELDQKQLSEPLKTTDHQWTFVPDKIGLDNLNPETEVISVFVTSTVTKEILDKLPKLRLIACRSTGFNNIDLANTKARDITVVNVPTYGESTVAEYAFTMLLALTRKFSDVLAAENTPLDQSKLTGTDLHGKTIGIIGTGHIGQHAIRIAKGFGMQVIAYDLYPNDSLAQELGFAYVELEQLYADSDIISLHAPLTPQTHHLLDAQAFNLMKPTTIVINTARGELVDTKSLVVALELNQIGGAALDVVEGESLLDHTEEIAILRSEHLAPKVLEHSIEISLLKKMPNVIISPHNAFNTVEAVGRINATTAQNIIDFWYGVVPNRIKPPVKPMGKLLVVRHAESEWNATGQWTGRTDVHLSDKGFKEASLLGQALKSLDILVDKAYCSEQIRTRETLESMLDTAQYFDVEVIKDGALNERDYGDYTGKNKWEMKELLGDEAFQALRRGWDYPVPNGETLKEVYERVVPFYTHEILPQLSSGSNILIVAHGNSIRSLMKYIESISDDDVSTLEMLFGDIVTYSLDNEGKMTHKTSTKIDSVTPDA